MKPQPRLVRSEEGISADRIEFDALVEAQEPVILRGAARDWPLVRHGQESARAAADYLLKFYRGKPVVAYKGKPEIGGRFFYDEAVAGLNFEAGRIALDQLLEAVLAREGRPDTPSFYIGSTDVDDYLPGLRAENDIGLDHARFEGGPPLVGIWIGNRTVAAAHYDMSHNIACCMVGRRRFTLFPPDQVSNLYPGPLAPTPGGQVVSMVDLRDPDLDRYPRAQAALAAALVADLEPGDLLFYPALWWHQVEALDAFNVMINYWWNAVPAYMDSPQLTLMHALLSLRDRPDSEKQAWRALFEYYVFGPPGQAGAHLPEAARGDLGPMDETKARRLRAHLLNKLNR